jgi:hypothetical protein
MFSMRYSPAAVWLCNLTSVRKVFRVDHAEIYLENHTIWRQIHQSKYEVVMRQSPAAVCHCVRTPSQSEHGSCGIYAVRSRYQTTEQAAADWKDLVLTLAKCGLCEVAIALELPIVTSFKSPIIPITIPNRIYTTYSCSRRNVDWPLLDCMAL